MDQILFNGNIVTMDTHTPRVSAIAMKDGMITAVGADEEILALKGTATTLTDLQQKTVVPGFNDNHLHLLDYARRKEYIDLDRCVTIDNLVVLSQDISTIEPDGIKEVVVEQTMVDGRFVYAKES